MSQIFLQQNVPSKCLGDRQNNVFSFQQNAGPFTCDLFAFFYNHKVKNSVDSLTAAVDAFSFDWRWNLKDC